MIEEIIFDFTGNPFVDAGIWAISEWIGKKPEDLNKKDLNRLIDDVVHLYLSEKWKKNIYSVFPNNPITNPSVKNKKENYSEFLEVLIDETKFLGNSGDCIACGRRDKIEQSGKDKIPMTGSKKFINYFSYGTEGSDYCPACAFAVQFVPLVLYKCGNMLLIHSNSKNVLNYWSKKTIKDVKKQLVLNNFTGCFDDGYKNPINALFHIIQDIILTYNERWYAEKPSIDFYHFTNYNQGPSLNIIHLPAPIFIFLSNIMQHEKYHDWKRIVNRGYVGVKWDKVENEDMEYKNYRNLVYNNLLNGKSIIWFFIDRKNKEAIGGWDLITNYLEEVRNMDDKRINAIKEVGDELAEYIRTADDIKTLKKLEVANNYRDYRNLLRIVIKKRISLGVDDPLFTFDDYVNYLFPDGNLSWRESQDLILFRIYEVLHDWIINQGISDELIVEEVEVEE